MCDQPIAEAVAAELARKWLILDANHEDFAQFRAEAGFPRLSQGRW